MSPSIFDNVGKSDLIRGGLFPRDGNFIVQLKDVKMNENTRVSGAAFILEHRVIAFQKGATVQDKQNAPQEAKPGMQITHMITSGGSRGDMFLPNVLTTCVQLVSAMDPRIIADTLTPEEKQQLFELVARGDKIACGKFFEMKAYPISTRAGKPFTRSDYMRCYQPADLREILPKLGDGFPEELVFPGGELQRLIDEQAKQAAAAGAAA